MKGKPGGRKLPPTTGMKKLAIVGAHEKTRANIPWSDENFDIWLFNEWAQADWCQRWDAVLQLHKPAVYRNSPNNPAHWDWLQLDHGEKVIYMQDADPNVPNSVRYPLEAVRGLGLTYNGTPVVSAKATAAYALALAVHLGYSEIHIYGIEMEHSSEYHSQQPSFAFWVGVAVGAGVLVSLHCSRKLFDGPLYGYEGIPVETKMLNYVQGMRAQQEENHKQAAMLEGAIAILTQMMNEDEL